MSQKPDSSEPSHRKNEKEKEHPCEQRSRTYEKSALKVSEVAKTIIKTTRNRNAAVSPSLLTKRVAN